MTDDQTAIVELIGVTKRYVRLHDAPAVLDSIDLRVAPGESVALVGPSGSGKTTLLNIIGTLDQPSEGRVLFEGADQDALNDKDLAEFRNRWLGFIFQSHHLLPQCTALENVLIPTLASSKTSRPRGGNDVALRLLKRVGLGDRVHHRPGELSVGQCQRVAVVRALINGPKLLLADEPTGSLDRAAAEELTKLLLELNREEKVTLIVATHSEHLARGMGRVLELRDARLHPVAGGS